MPSIIKNNSGNSGEETMAEEMSQDRAEVEPGDADVETETALAKGGGGGSGGNRSIATGSGQIFPTGSGTAAADPGFFHIYKSGQGYWTRMGSVGGAVLLILLVGHFFYSFLPTWSDTMRLHPRAMIGVVVGIVAALSLLTFYIINKPTNADFLIATDSEMKKVNWTSRAELIGSTKIVIIFVVLITALLFGIDVVFGYLFYFLKVLKQPPF